MPQANRFIKPGSRCSEWAKALNLGPGSNRFAEIRAFVRQTCTTHFFHPGKEISTIPAHCEFDVIIDKVGDICPLLTKNEDLLKRLEDYMKRYVVSCLWRRRVTNTIERAIAGDASIPEDDATQKRKRRNGAQLVEDGPGTVQRKKLRSSMHHKAPSEQSSPTPMRDSPEEASGPARNTEQASDTESSVPANQEQKDPMPSSGEGDSAESTSDTIKVKNDPEKCPETLLEFVNSLRPPIPGLNEKLMKVGITEMNYVAGLFAWSDAEVMEFLLGLEAEKRISRLDVEVVKLGLRDLKQKMVKLEA